MTPEAQRIAIAEACGWTEIERYQVRDELDAPWFTVGQPPENWQGPDARPWLPDFTSDLNAMHEAEETLTFDQRVQFSVELGKLTTSHLPASRAAWVDFTISHANAAQRAEAFLRATGRWEDTP